MDKAVPDQGIYNSVQAVSDEFNDDNKDLFYSKSRGMFSSAPGLDSNLAKILEKVDSRIFRQNDRAFKIYKDFDIDKDGFNH